METFIVTESGHIDRQIGQAVRDRRKELKLSQQMLAARIGVTFQQVQKYESGITRLSATTLFDIARVLDAPIGYFFDSLEPVGDITPASFWLSDKGKALAHTVPRIEPRLRRKVLELIEILTE
ncbi:helix-turn-helix domain-containing protein [Asticcacaulis sp. 201]|uniref:helix-turn-helix domain-containing protein n=1 Tax=Asticcacaulis sp. 201 TaxID=3028787 RepID=UPI002915C915|nr:helix-turn-helix domain-containing protein [Asticcacaulis sp. 201]MDV6330792.1 helix-turn-helix domain-containing protein [Asticcacaulis sp. 201]